MVPTGYGTRVPPSFLPTPSPSSKDWRKYVKRPKKQKLNPPGSDSNNINNNDNNNNNENNDVNNEDIDVSEEKKE